MSNPYGITPANLLRALPDVLRNDGKMLALATSIASELSVLSEDTALAVIYPNIDTLPERVLDMLANDFKVDWWSADYNLDEKRRTLKESWFVHRRLGTKRAVERALSAIFEDSAVVEWFEYGGKPYMFKVIIGVTATGVSADRQAVVLERVRYYKNLRSHLEAISYQIEKKAIVQAAAYHALGQRLEVYPYFARGISSSGGVFSAGFTQYGSKLDIYPNEEYGHWEV